MDASEIRKGGEMRAIGKGLITLVQLIKRFEDFMSLCLKEKRSWLAEHGLERKMWIVVTPRVMIGSGRQNNQNLIGLPTSRIQVCVCVRAHSKREKKLVQRSRREKKLINE
ncbi:hypothetical protein L195_g029411 [Trifolium pratense]|uniref:Uncharacterized protein n=1 Tax=Trifolium pratense TaxID=57577 RepID=A0A2K3L4R8_TRIPR|nr:hypothetical protein L195_g029411 [Trifolium pratense]